MSHATSSSSNSSYSVCSLPDTPSRVTAFSDDVTYSGPFHPSPFELLFLVNTGGHDDSLQNASVGQPHLQYAIDGLIRLRAQRVSLNAIIEETNVYVANLAFNAVAAGPTPLILQGPMTVPSLPPRSNSFEPQLPVSVSRSGSLSPDICNTDPNSPEFLQAATTYNARIRAAVELAHDQYDFCPHHTRTEPVLSGQADPSSVVPKLESPPSPDSIKPKPDADSPSDLVYPSDSSSRDSSPIYAQSIGVASASPSPNPEPQTPEPQPQPTPTPAPSDPFNPFDVDDEPLAPSTVPFLANGQFNPAFVSIRDIAHANPGIPIDTRTFTNAWADPASVWDDENVSETAEQAERRATVEEVHEFLCALCAEWRTTTPATVRATVARSADYLRLGIYLGIAVSDEGRIDFLERTIPGAHGLLSTISTGVTGTMTSTAMENSEVVATAEVTDPDELVPMFVAVYDGEGQAEEKRGTKVLNDESAFLQQSRQVVESFGFICHDAPADGEAELAALTERGVIDAVITKDSDVFPLGVQWVLLPDFKNSMVAKLMVHVYSAACIATQLNLTRDRLVFYSVLAGTDFGGVQGVGKSIALQLAQTGIADNLISDYQKPD
ncbi:hypothetical protein WG66_011986 [Moniliophthora roreri]|nr:hypothetical protein WG66_011986 [Moniliophthora roreri]